MKILVLSDHPDSSVLKHAGIDASEGLPFSLPSFDPLYLEPNTDTPESVKLFKYRLSKADALVVHVLPKQKLSDLIAWGKLHYSNWANLSAATVIREDCDFRSEEEMNSRLADVIDEDTPQYTDDRIVPEETVANESRARLFQPMLPIFG